MDHDKNGKPDRDTASKFYKTAAKGNPAAEKREKQVMGGTGRTASEVDMLHHRRRVEAAGGRVDTRPPRSLHMSRPLPGKNSAEKRRSSIGGSAAGSSGVVRGGGSNVGCSEPRTRPSLGANPSVTGAYLEAATRTASWAQDVQQARAESVNMAKVWFRVSGGGAEVDGAYVYDRESQHGEGSSHPALHDYALLLARVVVLVLVAPCFAQGNLPLTQAPALELDQVLYIATSSTENGNWARAP